MKNRKNGFSLIELIAVMVIISLVVVIFINVFSSFISSSKNTSFSITENNIINSSIAYVMEYSTTLENWKYELDENGIPDINSKYYCITVGDLINQGYFNNNILNNNINVNTYVKVVYDENSSTYTTSKVLNLDKDEDSLSLCDEYVVTFVDKDGNLIDIDGFQAQITVLGGYELQSDDFPNISSSSDYYSFTDGQSTFSYNGMWKNEDGEVISAGFLVNRDIVLTISYSLESGYGDAYLLSRGLQRPFEGESDDSSRYYNGVSIILTDNGGTSLADFVMNCEDVHNCVLSLDKDEIDNYLTLDTKNTLLDLESDGEEIDWYVLKYVDGTWHLDGQKYSDINIGFINLDRLNSSDYANCKYINNNSSCNYSDGYNLALSLYNDKIIITKVVINYSNNSITYNSDNLNKVEENKAIFSTSVGYYINNKITKDNSSRIKSVLIEYIIDDESYSLSYNYLYNNGIYIFEIVS